MLAMEAREETATHSVEVVFVDDEELYPRDIEESVGFSVRDAGGFLGELAMDAITDIARQAAKNGRLVMGAIYDFIPRGL